MKSSQAEHVRRQNRKRARRRARVAARQFGTRAHITELARSRKPLVTAEQVETEVLESAKRELKRRDALRALTDKGAEKMQALVAKVAAL